MLEISKPIVACFRGSENLAVYLPTNLSMSTLFSLNLLTLSDLPLLFHHGRWVWPRRPLSFSLQTDVFLTTVSLGLQIDPPPHSVCLTICVLHLSSYECNLAKNPSRQNIICTMCICVCGKQQCSAYTVLKMICSCVSWRGRFPLVQMQHMQICSTSTQS